MKREIEITLTPQELAEAFCAMFGDEQAAFFAHINRIAKNWPGAGWYQQSCVIIASATPYAIKAIRTLASHLPKEDVEWIVAASGDV